MSQTKEGTIGNAPFDYDSQPKEEVRFCNVCGSSSFADVAKRDRYGLNVSSHLCLQCGLVFISPRLKREGYALFYQEFYRPMVSHYLQKKVDRTTIQDEQKEYAQEVFTWLAPYLTNYCDVLRILDVGGSTGIVADTFKRNLTEMNIKANTTVIDPSPCELAIAKELGLKTIEGFAEDLDVGENCWDIVLLCQTIDHLLDAHKAVSAIRDALVENGLFFVDIVDWEYVVNKKGVEDSIKIDHPLNFTKQTVIPFLGCIGFEIVSESVLTDGHLTGFLCRKASPCKQVFSRKHAESLLSLVEKKQTIE
ncbi:MAG: class I SAM-dependent methyltransferase [Planctomycetes bacterium]|nr:class I SAM-dependent methyltransferase [Planctomycetota bacterium]